MSEDNACREQFEAWISGEPYTRSIARMPKNTAWPGVYMDIGVDLAWQAWKTAWELGDKCRDGCKIKRAVKEYSDNLCGNYEEPKSLGDG